jgi:hypothetical protein
MAWIVGACAGGLAAWHSAYTHGESVFSGMVTGIVAGFSIYATTEAMETLLLA